MNHSKKKPGFYRRKGWLDIQDAAFDRYGERCMMCGRTPLIHYVETRATQIRQKSQYPEMALLFTNIQVLCDDCRIGRSADCETDYRPEVLLLS